MLLIDKLINIVHLKSATAIMYVKKSGFYVQGHFPWSTCYARSTNC